MWEDAGVKGKSSFKISGQRKGTEGPNCGVRRSGKIVNFFTS